MPYREQKVTEAIKAAVAQIILEDIADPKLGFVTITSAKMTKDYKKIIIFFSVMGDAAQQEESEKRLNHAAGFIRNHLKGKVIVRYIPELSFEIDRLLEQEQRIGKVLDELNKPQGSFTTNDTKKTDI